MPFSIKPTSLVYLSFMLFCVPLTSQAISISAFRIYLDNDKPTTSFTIHNPNVEKQDCRLKLTHYNFDENSELIKLPEGEIPENSASNWIRFSPQEFTLTATHSQTIRFTQRKKANAEPAEYRSYLVIDCEAVSSDQDKQNLVSINPKLMHNVPIIVRNGNLEASIHVANIKAEDGVLSFSVERRGSRSIYADVELVLKSTDEVVSSQTGFSIYTESERFLFNLSTKDLDPKDLKIRVTENIYYGGNLVYETDVFPENSSL